MRHWVPDEAASSERLMTYLPFGSVTVKQRIGGPSVTQAWSMGSPVAASVTMPQMTRPVAGTAGANVRAGVGVGAGVGAGVGSGVAGAGVGAAVGAWVGACVGAAVGAAVVAAAVAVAVGAAVVPAGVAVGAAVVGAGVGAAVVGAGVAVVWAASGVGVGDAVVDCGVVHARSTMRTAPATAVVVTTRLNMPSLPFPFCGGRKSSGPLARPLCQSGIR